MHSIVTTFRGAVIKVEVANFCAAMDTLIDQDDERPTHWSIQLDEGSGLLLSEHWYVSFTSIYVLVKSLTINTNPRSSIKNKNNNNK